MPIDVRRAGDRFESRGELVVSRHSFSYGPHYDPANTRFGPLVAHNDDVLAPGGGFPEHPHRDLEIVTWVLVGALEHGDSTGGSGVLTPGLVGVLRTGAGVRHVERNASSGATRYLQMWLIADADQPASYATADVSAALGDGFVVVASSVVDAPVGLIVRGRRCRSGSFAPGPTCQYRPRRSRMCSSPEVQSHSARFGAQRGRRGPVGREPVGAYARAGRRRGAHLDLRRCLLTRTR